MMSDGDRYATDEEVREILAKEIDRWRSLLWRLAKDD
jgi:hypothetical protein